MNQVVLLGRLVRDVEMSYTPNSTAVSKFTLAVDRVGDEQADFIRITVFGKAAENCDRYIGKGSKVAVSGRIQTGSYKNKKGETVYTTDVIASRVEFLSKRTQEDEETIDVLGQLNAVDGFAAAEEDIPF